MSSAIKQFRIPSRGSCSIVESSYKQYRINWLIRSIKLQIQLEIQDRVTEAFLKSGLGLFRITPALIWPIEFESH